MYALDTHLRGKPFSPSAEGLLRLSHVDEGLFGRARSAGTPPPFHASRRSMNEEAWRALQLHTTEPVFPDLCGNVNASME